MVRKRRVFVDTSVFGGCFGEEFDRRSRQFFEEARSGRFNIVVSQTILDERKDAPERVRDVFLGISEASELVENHF